MHHSNLWSNKNHTISLSTLNHIRVIRYTCTSGNTPLTSWILLHLAPPTLCFQPSNEARECYKGAWLAVRFSSLFSLSWGKVYVHDVSRGVTHFLWFSSLGHPEILTMGAGDGLSCIKYLMFAFNFLFWVGTGV